MLHPGQLMADGTIEAQVEDGASSAIDRAASAEGGDRRFLRSAWFAAGADGRPLRTLVGRRAGSLEPVAALPVATRRLGPLAVAEVPGSYWPYRSFPLAADAGDGELAALLESPAARAVLGRAWRIGPVHADDPALIRLSAAAAMAGWTMLRRGLGTSYEVDLAGLNAAGPWPSSKTLRKNRWLERRLAEGGPLEFRTVTGDGWSHEVFDLLARIEGESWVGRDAEARDTKFLHPSSRRVWETAVRDPELGAMLFASLLLIGGEPGAFTFGLRCGDTLHIIANSYSERFREGSPGRILLYRDLQQAAGSGMRRIDWGAGDPGYKSQMGARPGPEIVDCLLVRGAPLSSLLRPFWRRR